MLVATQEYDTKPNSVLIHLDWRAVEKMTSHLLAGRRERAEDVLHAFSRNFGRQIVREGVALAIANVRSALNGENDPRGRLLETFEQTASSYIH